MKVSSIQFILDKMPQNMIVHANNTACLAYMMGKAINCSSEELEQLWFAGLLHESGKLIINQLLDFDDIPDSINKLSIRSKNKKHVLFTLALLAPLEEFQSVRTIISQVFENVDGSGEPNKLYAEEIDTLAKVVRICSEYDNKRLAGDPHEAVCRDLKTMANKVLPQKIINPFMKAIIMSGLYKEYDEINNFEIGGAPDFDLLMVI